MEVTKLAKTCSPFRKQQSIWWYFVYQHNKDNTGKKPFYC